MVLQISRPPSQLVSVGVSSGVQRTPDTSQETVKVSYAHDESFDPFVPGGKHGVLPPRVDTALKLLPPSEECRDYGLKTDFHLQAVKQYLSANGPMYLRRVSIPLFESQSQWRCNTLACLEVSFTNRIPHCQVVSLFSVFFVRCRMVVTA